MKPFGRVSMSKPFLTSLAALLILLAGSPQLHAGTQDFTLVNNTGLTIYQLYVTPVKTAGWGADLLGGYVLESGYEFNVTFSPDAAAKVWDLKIIDEEGEEIWWRSLRLNEITKVTLYYENGVATADYTWVE
jgi:hypothetical protein